MPVDFDPREVELLFEGLQGVGPQALEYLGFDFLAEATMEAPVRRGTLRGSIQATEQADYQWIIGSDLEYALYVHEGTRPHLIEANHAQALGPLEISASYLGVTRSGFGFFKSVMHPGTAPDPFFDRAIETVESRVDEYITMATEGIN